MEIRKIKTHWKEGKGGGGGKGRYYGRNIVVAL